jgi:hypothetical protein
MLRSTGLRVTARPADEIYLCEPTHRAGKTRMAFASQLQSIVGVIDGLSV